MLKTKSVWSPPSPKDGLRVLATRFRGRGLPNDRYDVWMATLGPSERLLHQFLDAEISWGEFGSRYRDELWTDGAVDADNATIKNHGQKFTLRLIKRLAESGPVTLMRHCVDDEPHCHLRVLTKIIESKRV
jgi:uncharacterized protein YeaO (DUF488 family)